MTVVTQTFVPGPRLIDGSDLNSLVNQINTGLGAAQATSSLTVTSSTVLAAVTGLSLTVQTGGVYNFAARLNGAAGAGGLKVAMGGTAAISASNVTSWNYNQTTLNAVTNQTTWGSSITAQTAAFTDLIAQGSFTVQTGGTIILQAAQNSSTTAPTTVAVGSSMNVWRVS